MTNETQWTHLINRDVENSSIRVITAELPFKGTGSLSMPSRISVGISIVDGNQPEIHVSSQRSMNEAVLEAAGFYADWTEKVFPCTEGGLEEHDS